MQRIWKAEQYIVVPISLRQTRLIQNTYLGTRLKEPLIYDIVTIFEGNCSYFEGSKTSFNSNRSRQ